MFKRFTFCLFSATILCSSIWAEAQDMSLGVYPSSGYVLQRGVLQVDAYGNYSNVSMGEALGIDFSGASGVGTYSELGGRVWFGLTEKTTVSFFAGSSQFEYGTKEAEIGYQELRLKRSLLIDHPTLGFWATEVSWFRHSMNSLTVSGVNLNSRANDLHDYGYGLKLSMTKALSDTWDFHSHIAYNKALEDGIGGQYSVEGGFGVSKFWNNRYRFDLYATMRSIEDIGLNLDDSNNSLHLGVTRHLSDQWSMDFRAQYNDNLFRGIWPFLDQEMGSIAINNYGYISIGFSYRTRY